MEIVSEPDLRSAEEAGLYLRKLRSILRYLGTCDGNMEEGSLRCDATSRCAGRASPYGTRCEIKNLNSVRFVMQAIEYEARRQVEVIEEGGAIAQQTRLFDVGRGDHPADALEGGGARLPLFPRSRPVAAGARAATGSTRLRAELPELPDAKKARFVADFGLSPDDAEVLVAEQRNRRVLRARWPRAATPRRRPTG